MRIVITGASGNVGTALLRRLIRPDADHDVIGIVRRPPKPDGVYGRVRWHGLDLADDGVAARLRPLFDGADAVVHLAWGFQPTRNLEYLTRVGVGGTAAVVTAAHDAEVGRLVHMSSVGTYAAGRYGRRVDESWSTAGIPTSAYSRDKSAAEDLLDAYEGGSARVPIVRMRPGFIVQRASASGLMRYALPGYIPMTAVPGLPILPLDRRVCIPLIHADDVADAVVTSIERGASGAFNLAADPPIRRQQLAEVLGAKAIHISAWILGTLTDLSWHAHLQPIDRGWVDLAFSVPLLDCGRAEREMNWRPHWSATAALADIVQGIKQRAHTASPPLRQRSLLDELYRDVTTGMLTTRHLP